MRFRDHVSPELVNLAPKLTDEQVNDLFAKIQKQNEERIEKRADRTFDERLEKNIEDTQDNVKEFIGKLSKAQKEIVVNYADDFKSSFDLWMDYRQRIQLAAYDMLLNSRHEEGFKSSFLALLSHPERYQSEELTAISAHNNQVYASMLEALGQSLSPKQKKKALNEIEDLIEDISDLQED